MDGAAGLSTVFHNPSGKRVAVWVVAAEMGEASVSVDVCAVILPSAPLSVESEFARNWITGFLLSWQEKERGEA